MLKARRHDALKQLEAAVSAFPPRGPGSMPLSAVAASARAAAAAAAAAASAASGEADAEPRGPFRAENPQEAGNEPCCAWCGLPLGDLAQASPQGDGERLHAECIREDLLRAARAEDEAKGTAAAEAKRALRAKFGIGWSPESVTPNHGPAAVMGCRLHQCSPGLCSVVLSTSSSGEHAAARLAPCSDPSASVNLEYLALAMQTLKIDGRAPLFSLEPVVASDGTPRNQWLQAKHFAPAWLEGTSAGEVMFQADVYMKELSMGEHPQPVVGMKSCMDLHQEEGSTQAWSGRVWFVIRKAELRISEDGALLPGVVMAARAREQVLLADGSLEDADVTRPDHPLLKYAEDFTHYFDLIAERMSVISHLRELARATVLATFLRENRIPLQVPELWKAKATVLGPREIPQLWNVRAQPQLHQRETEEEGVSFYKQVLEVYGGVSLAFDAGEVVHPAGGLRSLRQPLRAAPRLVPVAEAPRLVPLAEVQLPAPPSDELIEPTGASVGAPLSTGSESWEEIRGVELTKFTQTKLMMMEVLMKAKGVNTSYFFSYTKLTSRKLMAVDSRPETRPKPRLRERTKKQFRAGVQARMLYPDESLTLLFPSPSRAPARHREGSDLLAPVRGVDLHLDADELPALEDLEKAELSSSSRPPRRHGSGFWELLSPGPDSPFEPQERRFFQAVYSPQLSDRRREGELFVPLSLERQEYCSGLESLLKEERAARERRLEHFRSAGFSVEDPGPLFPYSWAAHRLKGADGAARRGELHERPDYTARQVREILQRAALVFEKRSEDGATFRVYQVGRLEIRTIEEPGAPEAPVAFFSSLPPPGAGVPSKADRVADHELLLKVTEYVQKREEAQLPHFFVVLETPSGHVLSEMLARESAPRWLENYEFLEDRLVGAKALRYADCDGSGFRLGLTKAFRASAASTFKHIAAREVSKRYADGLFRAASPAHDELRS